MLFSLSSSCAVTQRVPHRTPSTAHCLQPGGTSWPRLDRGRWPTRFSTYGRREKTSLLLDTSTLVSGKVARNTVMVRPQRTRPNTSSTSCHNISNISRFSKVYFILSSPIKSFHLYLNVFCFHFVHFCKFGWQGRNVEAL